MNVIYSVPADSYRKTSKHTLAIRSCNKYRGHAVAHLIEAMRYKPEGGGFNSRWCHWNFSLTYSLRPHYGTGFDSASNRNEYQEYFLGVKAAGA